MVIENKGVTPKGKITISGAKNSATRLLAASTLTNEKMELKNFPTELVDAREKARFLKSCGVDCNFQRKSDTVTIFTNKYEAREDNDFDIPIRTTYLLAAGQLKRHKKALIPYPGGCKIGERKYDLHIMVWERLGCRVIEKENHIEIVRPDQGMQGAIIDFPISTVGGTENAILCALVAKGQTIVKNAYVTPEILDMINMLKQMGASIELKGNSYLKIDSCNDLRGVNYSVMPDRIEAITWIVYAAITGAELLIKNVPLKDLEIPLIHLKEAGVDLYFGNQSVYLSKDSISKFGIQPFELACGTHPGIISDMQPFYVLLALKANGRSKVFDYRYPNRVAYLDELNKFCNNAISYSHGEITINGPVEFTPAKATGKDLRGSMAVIMAALFAKGKSEISNSQMALRGYNKLVDKLALLGIEISDK